MNKFGEILRHLRTSNKLTQTQLASSLGLAFSTISMYERGEREPDFETLEAIADYFNVSLNYLLNKNDNNSFTDLLNNPHTRTVLRFSSEPPFAFPTPEKDTVTFPVIGEVAAGYDCIALEDWDGETVEIPSSYLKGRNRSEFFVLKVKGDSMYPEYQDGDKVLVLKQSTLNYSGQVGVVLYDGELATLKKVEYKQGEDWMRFVAINPSYPPKTIENEDLELCRVLGIPKYLIREIYT